MRIVLAEDEDDIRKLLADYLKRRGFIVCAVENGALLLQALERQEFDAIITDDRMPEKNGTEVLALIRDEPRFRHLKRILFSGSASTQEAADVGATLLSKPVRLSTLVALLT